MQCNSVYSHMQLSHCHLFSHAYHYCQEPYRLHLSNLSHSNGSQVFQPCNDRWYLPKICSRISQICLCISVSSSLRWSRNIAMMSRWFAFRRTSSSNGKSHSKRTSTVCISRNTLVTFSKPIIQPMYCSSIASRNGRLSRRLSILSTNWMAIPFSVHRYLSPTRTNIKLVQTHHSCLQDLLSTSVCLSKSTCILLFAYLQASCRSSHCPNTSLVSPGLAPNLSLSRYSQCSSPGKLSESSLSKHLTCVSRTYSQPQPVEILQAFQNMSSPAINWQVTFNKWPYSQHATKMKWDKNTSPKSRILKLFDALDFTSTMYQPSDHFRTLVQAQHRSLQKIQELNTNDLSFTLDGVLSTLQQGSAENGVGSSVELRYHVEKAPCTDLRSDLTLLQNSYRTTQADAYVNHAHQTQAQSVNSRT